LSKIIFLLLKKNFRGIVNVVSDESLSKYDFGLKVLKTLNLDKSLIIKSKMKNTHRAKRCKNLSLSNTRLNKITNFQIPSLNVQLKNFFKEKDLIEKKIFSKIPYGKHSINNFDIRSVTSVLKSGSLTQGNYISETEKKIANYVGCKYAVLVSSATAGLHITYKALNLSKKNSLITSPITFVSTANAAFYCNSKVLFSDINEDTISLSTSILKKRLVQNKNNVKIISPVHMGGLAANMKEINKIAKVHKIKVVEDAAHAIGALYECGSKVGSCKYSDATVFSFHPVKIIASGEGGVVTTNDYKLYLKLLSLRTHGITSESIVNKKFGYTKGIRNLWYYEMQNLGYHYRQTEIHAALLNSQLDRIDTFLNKRKNLAKRYDQAFDGNNYIQLPQKNYRNISSNHLYILKLNFEKLKINRNDFMKKLREYNIITQVHYIPLPIHPFYKKKGYDVNKYKNSLKYYDECLSIPIYYDLSYNQQDYVISAILELTQ
jgi:UDP-4-amino-4,6-dideoxy-N-acetyl-beta-L-altrosamine transaminase